MVVSGEPEQNLKWGRIVATSTAGTVVKYSTRKGTRYKAVVQYRGKKHIEGGFLTKTQAQKRAWRMKEELLDGTYLSPREKAQQEETAASATITVRDYAQRWLDRWRSMQADGRVSANTIRTYKSCVRHYVLPALGDRTVASLSEEDIREWYASVAPGKSASTRANVYRALSSMMRSAVEDRLIPVSPCRVRGAGSTRPGDNQREQYYFTHSEYLSLIGALEASDMPSYAGIAALLYYTACRPSEARALRGRDFDFEHARVWYGSGMQRSESGEVVEGPTKTRRGRWAPMCHQLVEYVRPIVERAERDEWVFHAPGDVSQPASDKHVSRRARRALDSIGLERAELYDLKHTCLTNLGRAGASLKELMDLPGHSQIETVLKYQLSDFERVASAVGRMANNLK